MYLPLDEASGGYPDPEKTFRVELAPELRVVYGYKWAPHQDDWWSPIVLPQAGKPTGEENSG
jgi:hypothetical protein